MLVSGIAEIAIVGAPDDPATQALIDVAQQPYRPNAITALASANVEGEADDSAAELPRHARRRADGLRLPQFRLPDAGHDGGGSREAIKKAE